MQELSFNSKILMGEIAEGLIVISPDYRIRCASPLIVRLTGLEEEELRNKFCYQILRQREAPCEGFPHECPLKEVIHSGKPVRSFQHYLNAQKEEVSLAVEWYPIEGERGEVTYIIGVLKDVAELNGVKSNVERLSRFAAMGELFHGIGHNLNTPLSAVMARGEMLVERLKRLREGSRKKMRGSGEASESPLDKCVRDAEVIVANAVKLAEIIRNMMQKGIQESEELPQMLNLSALLKEELTFLESDMKFKHEIEKRYFLDDSVPYIQGVYHHFSQSFINLIRNAMESLGQSDIKELTITSKYDKNSVYIEIHDTGALAQKGTKGRHRPLTLREMRFDLACELLKLYGAEVKVKSKSQDNLYAIRIPYKSTGSIG